MHVFSKSVEFCSSASPQGKSSNSSLACGESVNLPDPQCGILGLLSPDLGDLVLVWQVWVCKHIHIMLARDQRRYQGYCGDPEKIWAQDCKVGLCIICPNFQQTKTVRRTSTWYMSWRWSAYWRFKSTSKSFWLCSIIFMVFLVVRPPIHIYGLNIHAIKITLLLYE